MGNVFGPEVGVPTTLIGVVAGKKFGGPLVGFVGKEVGGYLGGFIAKHFYCSRKRSHYQGNKIQQKGQTTSSSLDQKSGGGGGGGGGGDTGLVSDLVGMWALYGSGGFIWVTTAYVTNSDGTRTPCVDRICPNGYDLKYY